MASLLKGLDEMGWTVTEMKDEVSQEQRRNVVEDNGEIACSMLKDLSLWVAPCFWSSSFLYSEVLNTDN